MKNHILRDALLSAALVLPLVVVGACSSDSDSPDSKKPGSTSAPKFGKVVSFEAKADDGETTYESKSFDLHGRAVRVQYVAHLTKKTKDIRAKVELISDESDKVINSVEADLPSAGFDTIPLPTTGSLKGKHHLRVTFANADLTLNVTETK